MLMFRFFFLLSSLLLCFCIFKIYCLYFYSLSSSFGLCFLYSKNCDVFLSLLESLGTCLSYFAVANAIWCLARYSLSSFFFFPACVFIFIVFFSKWLLFRVLFKDFLWIISLFFGFGNVSPGRPCSSHLKCFCLIEILCFHLELVLCLWFGICSVLV